MSKRDYFLQKGLQMKRLDEQITSSSTLKGGSSASREVSRARGRFKSWVTLWRYL